MATTDTGIANLALARIGGKQITSLTADTTREDRLCNALYADTLDELLIQADWNFARHIYDLAETVDLVEIDEYTYVYDLPVSPVPLMWRYSSVKLKDDETDDLDWQLIGNYIYSDTLDLRLVATTRVSVVTDMPVYFQSALASALALKLFIPLVADLRKYQIISTTLGADISTAIFRNQDENPDRNNPSALLWDRAR